MTGLSVEFNATKETRRNGLRVIVDGLLTGGALVDFPAYRQALAEVRQQETRRRKIWL